MTAQDEISSGIPPAAAVLPRAVRRALDFMQSAIERDIGVAELAAAVGLSARALQRQFKTFLGKSPHNVTWTSSAPYFSARNRLFGRFSWNSSLVIPPNIYGNVANLFRRLHLNHRAA